MIHRPILVALFIRDVLTFTANQSTLPIGHLCIYPRGLVYQIRQDFFDKLYISGTQSQRFHNCPVKYMKIHNAGPFGAADYWLDGTWMTCAYMCGLHPNCQVTTIPFHPMGMPHYQRGAKTNGTPVDKFYLE